MKLTTNYSLKKPDGTDLVNIDDLNTNMDTVDTQIKAANTAITTHMNDSTKHMTAVDRTKIDGIATGATKTVISNNLTTTTTGTALDAAQGKVLNDTITAHGNDTVKHITATERITWNSKANATVATASTPGLLSAADKSKLDGIASQANKTVISNNLTTTATGTALDAAQGKVLNDKIDQANSKFTNDLHKYFMGGLIVEPAFNPYE